MKYYSLKRILDCDAHYNLIFGERSNGKTFAILKYGIEQYLKTGKQMGYIRRWEDDIKGNKLSKIFDALVAKNIIEKLSRGQWTGIYYNAREFRLMRKEESGNRVIDDNIFCYAFSISAQEHYKSISFPNITTIFFDEFITRKLYLTDEFILYTNLLSTIIRDRKDVKIFMAGNTVNRYSNPYFLEMGLTHVKDMKPGTIDVYTYGESELRVAVEYTMPNKEGKASDVYFAFDNSKLNMITSGVWEIAMYPHCPCEFLPKHIRYIFFISFEGELLQCEVVNKDDLEFIYIHRKTTPLKNENKDLIFSPDYNPRPNWRRKITGGATPIEQAIGKYFILDKVFYQDNEVGEIVNSYLKWCSQARIIRA